MPEPASYIMHFYLSQKKESHFYIGLLILLLSGVMTGCGASSPYYKSSEEPPDLQADAILSEKAQFTLFLIGDTGAPETNPLEPNLQILQHHLEAAGEQSAVVFLGDNIYTYGLLPEEHPEREQSEQRINAQLKMLENYSGQPIFTPGNHDWNNDRPGGREALQRQQQYIEARLGDAAFMPDEGCPGPETVPLDSSSILLPLDTEWWLYPHNRPGPEQCENGSEERFIQAVDSLIAANSNKNIIVTGHHPLYSNGTHNGYFPFREHIFPISYVPLPLITSINPLYRRYIGYRQDLAGKEYSKLRKGLTAAFSKHKNLIYASGHDHSLQYHPVGGQHYIVSGAGTVESFVRKGKSAAFAYSHKGFARIDVYDDSILLSFWTPEGNSNNGRLVYQKVLFTN